MNPTPSNDFFAHHSPFGAFSSFTLGRYGKKGGFGLELSGPANQDVYVALARPSEGVTAFPFYEEAAVSPDEAAAYTGGGSSDTAVETGFSRKWRTFAPEAITRRIGWASDSWSAGDLSFTLYTPWGEVPDPLTLGDMEIRRHLCPAIIAEITVDNTASDEEAFAFFGIGSPESLRLLSDTDSSLSGIALETRWGFAVQTNGEGNAAAAAAQERLSWLLQEEVALASSGTPPPPLNRLANRGGLLLRAAPGEKKTYTLALGFYRSGIVTSGIAATYLYSRLFPDLEAVLLYALQNAGTLKQTALARDAELSDAALNDDRKFLLAHATHSYHGSTMLLHDERGALPRAPFSTSPSVHQPLWVVNEGEYRMLNTFDLTVDQAFFEMRYHPWTLKNTLDLFVGRYAYTDDVQDATDAARPRFPGGISFTHDMGVANHFTPPASSSYERADLDGCFSFMTQEQLCNWCLCAALYGLPVAGKRKGDLLWLASRRATLHACLQSLINRDGPDALRNGVMSLDALRCGKGQEITTYDSLDVSLGQARANAYLAVKTWAAYLALSRCFDLLGVQANAAEAEQQAARAAEAITAHFDSEGKCLPAVFENDCPGWESRIIPAIEGLAFPVQMGDDDAASLEGPYGELISILRQHLETVLVPGICIDPVSGGFKMSSTSENTWLSKIFLSQYVAETVLNVPLSDSYDAAHAKWQREGNSRDFAFTDQVRSTDGLDLGSRYYPRGVTAILWLP